MVEPGSVAALFAGIGGIESGLARSGMHAAFLCESWLPAQHVLRSRFPGVPLVGDIRDVSSLPEVEVVSAGFPCTDLSQAGRTAGIDGEHSGLVHTALALVARSRPKWLLLENVRNMLPLHRGRAMAAITSALESMDFRWAYRVVDSRFAGVPQRRQRVILLASRTEDPCDVLFADTCEPRDEAELRDDCFGFYWTEGTRGLGWCRDGVPTLKGGSTIGIPSPPAVWRPHAPFGTRIVTPGLATAERLQGFPRNWTLPGGSVTRGVGARWKLVGNAVTVGVAEWIGRRLVSPGSWDRGRAYPLEANAPWPLAAYGSKGSAWSIEVGMWPERRRYVHLGDLMREDWEPLSARATAGFLARLERGTLRAPATFKQDLRDHIDALRRTAA